jgi:serine/threonine protein kinase
VGYMAPEQRQGHMLDSRTDIFGVGAIAYELLSGAALDLGPLALGLQGWPQLRRPSTLRRDVPLELDDVVMRALAYDRDQRWSSCAELESTLERIATWAPPIATDETIGAWARELLATAP